MVAVVITRDDDIETAIAEALGHIDLEPLVRGKLVALKPNETWASAEDTTGVTQPDTLRAVLRHVKRFGPRELVVSGGAGAAETDEVFRLSGMTEVLQQEGVAFFSFDDMHSFIRLRRMAKRFPIDLAITVGHPAMIGTGPLGGHVVETGLVIAGTDPVAADVVGAKLLGFSAQAGRLGLGETDLEKIEFPAMRMREAIEAFTSATYGERLTFEHA